MEWHKDIHAPVQLYDSNPWPEHATEWHKEIHAPVQLDDSNPWLEHATEWSKEIHVPVQLYESNPWIEDEIKWSKESQDCCYDIFRPGCDANVHNAQYQVGSMVDSTGKGMERNVEVQLDSHQIYSDAGLINYQESQRHVFSSHMQTSDKLYHGSILPNLEGQVTSNTDSLMRLSGLSGGLSAVNEGKEHVWSSLMQDGSTSGSKSEPTRIPPAILESYAHVEDHIYLQSLLDSQPFTQLQPDIPTLDEVLGTTAEINTQRREGTSLVHSDQPLQSFDSSVDLLQSFDWVGNFLEGDSHQSIPVSESNKAVELFPLSTQKLVKQSPQGTPKHNKLQVQARHVKRRDEFDLEKNHICKIMLGRLKTKDIPRLEETLDHIIYIHRRWKHDKNPFHVHPDCTSMEDVTAPACCWSKQFETIFLDDNKILQSFQQMCTDSVNMACFYHTPKKRVVSFPDFVVTACEEWVKSHVNDPQSYYTYKKDEVQELADNLGLFRMQVLSKLRFIRNRVYRIRPIGSICRKTKNNKKHIKRSLPGDT